MPRYKLTVAYDGTNFHGWQKQKRTEWVDPQSPRTPVQSPGTPVPGTESELTHAHSGAVPGTGVPGLSTGASALCANDQTLRTVQGVLEEAVRWVVREPVNVLGASRTDAGVHARGQVAAFTTNTQIPVEKLPRAITSRLPDDVQVLRADTVPDDFDPIKGAIAKGYRYCLAHSCARHRKPLFDRYFVTHTAYRLDPVRMNEAARYLLGEHDFTSFTRIAHGRESTVRTIYECKVIAKSRTRCHIEVAGNGFLYNMVRIIAGTLVEVGRGVLEPTQIREILAAKDRNAAGTTLPPEGLCLMWIRYE